VRIRKLRVFALLAGLILLAAVSTVFGMMMAVASDLPRLEEPADVNSVLVDRNNKPIGVLTGNTKRIFLQEWEIAPVMKHAIIAVEDRRFYTNEGIDLRGIGRAFVQDVLARKAVQGGSTITQQFVKNALAAQNDRTLFQKLREAALAYHLTRKWSKERILKNYLNTIYFGNGAYGIESAARAYFMWNHPGCDEEGARPCALQLLPHEAALLSGIVANPSAYDPIAHPRVARQRRDLVLARMLEQGFLTQAQYQEALGEQVPTRDQLQPPQEETEHPYFTSWIKQQVVDQLGGGQQGARLAFEGGLRVKTTIDSDLQAAAEDAITAWLPYEGGPRASLVAIDNRSGEVLAMVGGDDYESSPFNLATQGQRQPGSAIKPFILARAISDGISPGSVWASHKLEIRVPNSGGEIFTVNNYEDSYSGSTTLASATTFSDNSVYAQVGLDVGTKRVARLAKRMGIRTPVSTNYAMTLGGLKQGVTPLDMAHAYETFAAGGRLVYGTLSPGTEKRTPGPVGIKEIERVHGGELPNGEKEMVNERRTKRVLEPEVATTVGSILQSVVSTGTGTRAQVGVDVPVAGKTGTTEGYGDAWFVGWTPRYTVAVWVGYPDKFRPMETEFNGEPVAGGTFPASIFRTFVDAAYRIRPLKEEEQEPPPTDPTAPVPVPGTEPTTPTEPAPTTPAPTGGTGGADDGAEAPAPEPEAPAPAPEPAEPAPAPGTGGGAPAPP
jgi:penicillin-binding protein 1A